MSDEDLAAFGREVKSYLTANRPAEPDFVMPQSFLEVETEQQFTYLRAWQRQLYEAGHLGFDVPEQYGGRGVDQARHAIVMRELANAQMPFLVNTIGLRWVVPTILKYGTEEQKQRLVKPILSTDHIWCQGFSEPEAGSDLASLQTRAVRHEDGYRVTGHKVWTTLAHFAQFMILLARTDAEANKYRGLSYFLFPMGEEGVTIQPLLKMSAEGGFNQVIFDDAPMPHDALLGKEGQGWEVAMATLTFERGAAGVSGEATSGTSEMLDRLVKCARDSPRKDDRVLRDRLASLWIDTEAARFGERRAAQHLPAERPMALPMMSKLVRSEIDQDMAALGCDYIGKTARLGIDDPAAPDEGEWPRAYMNSFGFTIGGGTSEIQRNLLAERVLGLPRSR
ncbi:acyl-CoA dehydrogenase family protein [Desulfobulbus sp. AH-315-M07]|nr:acyl-CoA dehydrogenase family protein [Desulfobulbus sp. AH-315-M07]